MEVISTIKPDTVIVRSIVSTTSCCSMENVGQIEEGDINRNWDHFELGFHVKLAEMNVFVEWCCLLLLLLWECYRIEFHDPGSQFKFCCLGSFVPLCFCKSWLALTKIVESNSQASFHKIKQTNTRSFFINDIKKSSPW